MRMSQVNSLVRVLTAAGVSLLFGAAFDCARAEELQASLHPVDAAAKRVDMSMSWGDVLFKPGSKDKEVKILVQIEDATVSSGEPLAQDGGPSIYRHALQIRNVSTCEDTSTDKGLGGELPDVDILSNGSATLEITAVGISMSQLPGKTVVLYRGKSVKEKRDIVACGVIGPKK